MLNACSAAKLTNITACGAIEFTSEARSASLFAWRASATNAAYARDTEDCLGTGVERAAFSYDARSRFCGASSAGEMISAAALVAVGVKSNADAVHCKLTV